MSGKPTLVATNGMLARLMLVVLNIFTDNKTRNKTKENRKSVYSKGSSIIGIAGSGKRTLVATTRATVILFLVILVVLMEHIYRISQLRVHDVLE